MPWRRKKRHSDEVEAAMPCSDRYPQSSASVMSGVSSSAAWITPALASILRDRMSPPCGFGAKDPVDRRSMSQRIAVDGATPYRAAAARRLKPVSIASITRSLRSIEVVCPSLPPISASGSVNQNLEPLGIPIRFKSVGKHSNSSKHSNSKWRKNPVAGQHDQPSVSRRPAPARCVSGNRPGPETARHGAP